MAEKKETIMLLDDTNFLGDLLTWEFKGKKKKKYRLDAKGNPIYEKDDEVIDDDKETSK